MRDNGALRIIGAIRLKRFCRIAATVRITRSSNMRALLEAGFSTDDVKIVILKSLFPNEYHAVAAARVNGEWLIMDNRTLTLVRDMDLTRATPEFVLDHEGVRRFNWASRDRVTMFVFIKPGTPKQESR
jgi:hypothetical protein